MRFSENFEAAKNIAVEAAQTAAAKAKELAAVAKANISIYAEEDKVKKAEIELGKLYYRDYAVGEELDTAEYLPWCQKIDESKKTIADLKDYIASLRIRRPLRPALLICYIQCRNANKDHTYQRKCDLIHITPYGFL